MEYVRSISDRITDMQGDLKSLWQSLQINKDQRLYMAGGDCSFTIACHVDPEFKLLKITRTQGDFLMVQNFNSWCG